MTGVQVGGENTEIVVTGSQIDMIDEIAVPRDIGIRTGVATRIRGEITTEIDMGRIERIGLMIIRRSEVVHYIGIGEIEETVVNAILVGEEIDAVMTMNVGEIVVIVTLDEGEIDAVMTDVTREEIGVSGETVETE